MNLEWQGKKINIIDAPGYLDFHGEVKCAMRVADLAGIVVSASDGIDIGTETCCSYADKDFKIPNADVVHIDAGHTFQEVVYDIERLSKQLDNPTFIFDDYGHEGRTVRDAINTKLSDGTIKLVTHIGEDKGYVAANNKTFIGREGVICDV